MKTQWDFRPKILLLYLCGLINISAARYPVDNYYAGYLNSQQSNVEAALQKLQHAPKWSPEWPDPEVKLGQVSGVAIHPNGQVLVFHRGNNVWDTTTFNMRNVYQNIGELPIAEATVLVFNDTGELAQSWGQKLFYMPHGITVDPVGNVWLTDVALHQVFKFTPQDWTKPALTLGEKFVPGPDHTHFCKPSAVAVLSSGDFFVADGYCNTRIIKFAPDGSRVLQWGKELGQTPYSLNVPHALALVEEHGQICVADRENGRVLCYKTEDGSHVATYKSWLFGGRVFSVAYAPVRGGRLYIVNGPGSGVPVRGYVLDFPSGKLIQTFNTDLTLRNPHDIAVSADGRKVYVAELNPYRVYKFMDDTVYNDTNIAAPVKLVAPPAKPTAVIESISSEDGSQYRGAWLAGAGAMGAALAAGAGLAMLRAKAHGNRNSRAEVQPLRMDDE